MPHDHHETIRSATTISVADKGTLCRPELAAGENKLPTEFMYGNASFPKAVDWRKKGAVTPVKNQQQVCAALHAEIEQAAKPLCAPDLNLLHSELTACGDHS